MIQDGIARRWAIACAAPTNDEGVEAGCYNDNAELVATWPCFVMTDDDGNMDVYTVANVRAWSE